MNEYQVQAKIGKQIAAINAQYEDALRAVQNSNIDPNMQNFITHKLMLQQERATQDTRTAWIIVGQVIETEEKKPL